MATALSWGITLQITSVLAIRTAVATGASGAAVSLMECGATYDDYLQGLNPQEIERLTREANDNGKFAGLKIGDLTTPDNNAGNWE